MVTEKFISIITVVLAMKSKVFYHKTYRHGTSVGIVIPREILEILNLKPSTFMKIYLQGKKIIMEVAEK